VAALAPVVAFHGRISVALRWNTVHQPDPPDGTEQNPEPEQGPNIVMPPDEFAGKWANAAAIARTPHEFTLDFLRIGPQGQQGVVVSRVSFSPLLASQLLDLLGEQWQAYTEESGIPPGGDA
jgi:uncharacterized protein DUF3467